MRIYPKRVYTYSIIIILFSFFVHLSCSKDTETLKDVILKDPSKTIINSSEQDTITNIKEEALVEEILVKEDTLSIVLESRTTVFSPKYDAHLQNGEGYNQNIIRLEENRRTSYLMFDLTPIDSIGGKITTAKLSFTINSDDGDGEIIVYKGASNDWTEDNLSEATAPNLDIELGALSKEYKINKNETIQLSVKELPAQVSSLVLLHKDGDDLAFASKEHPQATGPQLIVTYEVSKDSDEISIESLKTETSEEENSIDEIAPSVGEQDDDASNEEEPKNENPENQKDTVEKPEESQAEEDSEEIEQNEPSDDVSAEEEIQEEEEEEEEEEQNESSEDVSEEEEIQEEEQNESLEDVSPEEKIQEKEQSESPENVSAEEEIQEEEQNESPEDVSPEEEIQEEEQSESPENVSAEEEIQEKEQIETSEEEEEEEEIPLTPNNNTTPVAKANASTTKGSTPLKVSFNGNDSSDDKEVTSYVWDFKDGDKSNQINPVHTFTKVGAYKVLLTVKDREGLSSTDEIVITVEDVKNDAPIAKIITNTISGEAPLKISFKGDGSTDDDSITSYAWDFKDGSTSTGVNISHTFSKAGSYEVELTVKDKNGLTDKELQVIEVSEAKNEGPTAKVSATPVTGAIPLKVQFKGDTSADDKAITNYQWDFKDGTTSSDENPSHTFTSEGTYSVELTVKDKEGLTNKKTITITTKPAQNEPPKSKITTDISSGYAPLKVNFTGSQSTDDNEINSFLWKFNDGEQDAIIENPEHTFKQPGIYTVELTVKDKEGLSHTSTTNITVNEQDTGNAPAGSYFVTTNGSSNNDGLSEATAWSIEYAGQNAKAGDYVFIKAGNYGNVTLKPGNSGNSSNPIRFIGYKNSPGDIIANSGSTFSYGNNLDPSKMPLLKGNRINKIGQGTGIYNFHNYIEFSNIQITEYGEGVFSSGDHTVFDNIIVTEIGDFDPSHTYPNNTSNQSLNYAGVGIKISGDYAIIKNCFVLNAGAEGYRFSECRYQKHSNNKAYSNSTVNPCDYYYLLSIGAENNDVSDIYVERVGNLEHSGHGLVLKFSAKNNIIRNSTVKNTWLELSYSNVTGNSFTNCTVVGGPNNQGALLIANGANNNTFTQCRVTQCDGVSFSDWDEDFSRGDVRNAGHHNTFKQCTFDNNLAGINFFWYSQNNIENKANDNTFDGCTFRDMEQLFLVDRANTNTVIKNSTISNISQLKDSFYPTVNSGIALDAYYQNNNLQNCGFTLD